MEVDSVNSESELVFRPEKARKLVHNESRIITIPQHRITPLKRAWKEKIMPLIVENLN